MTIIKKLALAGSVAALGMTTPALAAPYTAPTASGTATVRLYNVIEIARVKHIDFGTVIRGAAWAGGSISMDALGATNCAALPDVSCTGSPTEGHFTIKGDSGADMSVSFGSATYDPLTNVLQLVNGANAVDLTLSFSGMTQNTDPVSGNNLNTFSVPGTGAATDIKLFGNLAVGTSVADPNGLYTASFTLTADYK